MSVTLTNWSRSCHRRSGDAGRPVHDQRHVDAALVGVLLVPLERRVAALRPAPRVVRVAVRAADVVDPLDGLVGRLEDPVEELHLVHHAERPALLATRRCRRARATRCCRARPRSRKPVDEPADLVVGVVEERGERLLQAARQPLLVLGQVVPRLDAGVARRELGARGDRRRARAAAANQRSRTTSQPSSNRPAVLLQVARPAPGAARGSRRTGGRGRTAGRAARPRCRTPSAAPGRRGPR